MNFIEKIDEKWPLWLVFYPILFVFFLHGDRADAGFLTVFFACALLFSIKKTLHLLHFGTRNWTRSLWILISVGFSPFFLKAVFELDFLFLFHLNLAAAAVFCGLSFFENEEKRQLNLLSAAGLFATQILLGTPVFGLEIVILVLLFNSFFFEKKDGRRDPVFSILTLLIFVFFQKKDGSSPINLERFWVILFPFWPFFGFFMTIFLFFLKKNDRNTFPKNRIIWGVSASVFAAFLLPENEKSELAFAWLGLVFLAYPSFERALLYGLQFVENKKIWWVVGGILMIQWAIFLLFFL
jgi:hypothetical protein